MDFIEFIKTVLLSLIFILLIHTIFIYFKDNFTEKKTYDYVNNPDQKYKDIYNKINSEENQEKDAVKLEIIPKSENVTNDGTTNISDLTTSLEKTDTKKDMKDELKNFLKGVQSNELPGYENEELSNNQI
jgi:Fe-S cluster biosynthesis and repair protein YggX